MSTHSNIIVRIPEEWKGKEITFDANKLPIPCAYVDYDSYMGETSIHIYNPYTPETRRSVKLGADYMAIGCHWDGYIADGVGEELIKDFKTVEDVLNLVAGGYVSGIACGVYDDGWRGKQSKRPKDCEPYFADKEDLETLCDCMSEYIYLFEDGKWKYNENDGIRFHDLARRLKKEQQEAA